MKGLRVLRSQDITDSVRVCLGDAGDRSKVWIERCGHCVRIEQYWDAQDAACAFRWHVARETERLSLKVSDRKD